jgi:hypothetical protein
MITASGRAKTFHALDSSVAVTGAILKTVLLLHYIIITIIIIIPIISFLQILNPL